MRIAFLTSCLAPGLDGVGDYTRELALACASSGHSCALVALNDRHVTRLQEPSPARDGVLPELRLPAAEAWPARLGRAQRWLREWGPEAVSLQFVAYGFHPKGLIGDLGARLRPLVADWPLELMMHELWIGLERGAPLKRRIIGSLQRRAITRFVAELQPSVIHTSNATFAALLARYGLEARLLPLFGSIPIEARVDPEWLTRELQQCGVAQAIASSREDTWRFGFFGSVHPSWSAAPFFGYVREAAAQAQRHVVMASIGRLGPGEALWQDLRNRYRDEFSFARLGERQTSEVSAFLQSVDFGVGTTPWQLIGKSGTAAAMLEHGLPVVVARDDQEYGVPGPFTTDPLLHRMDEQLPQRLLTAQKRAPHRRLPDVTRDFLADLTALGSPRGSLATPSGLRDPVATS